MPKISVRQWQVEGIMAGEPADSATIQPELWTIHLSGRAICLSSWLFRLVRRKAAKLKSLCGDDQLSNAAGRTCSVNRRCTSRGALGTP